MLTKIFFLLRTLPLDFMYLTSSDKSYSLNDESNDNGSDSGSSGTCVFPFCFDKYVGRVSGLESGVFFQ